MPGIKSLNINGITLSETVTYVPDISGNIQQIVSGNYNLTNGQQISDSVNLTIGDSSNQGIPISKSFSGVPYSLNGAVDINNLNNSYVTGKVTDFSYGNAGSANGAVVTGTGAQAPVVLNNGLQSYLNGYRNIFNPTY